MFLFSSDLQGGCVLDSTPRGPEGPVETEDSSRRVSEGCPRGRGFVSVGPKPDGDLPMAAGARGTVPSVEGPCGAIEGNPGLGVLNPYDFMLHPEVLRAFAMACSLFQSGAIVGLASLQVGSIGYDLSGPVLGLE